LETRNASLAARAQMAGSTILELMSAMSDVCALITADYTQQQQQQQQPGVTLPPATGGMLHNRQESALPKTAHPIPQEPANRVHKLLLPNCPATPGGSEAGVGDAAPAAQGRSREQRASTAAGAGGGVAGIGAMSPPPAVDALLLPTEPPRSQNQRRQDPPPPPQHIPGHVAVSLLKSEQQAAAAAVATAAGNRSEGETPETEAAAAHTTSADMAEQVCGRAFRVRGCWVEAAAE